MDYSDVTVVLPSLNPDETLCQVVDSLLEAGFRRIILVNDGSDPEHTGPFLLLEEYPEVTLLTHEVNRGKGAAMKTAFAYILESIPDSAGAVTVDGDGQHRAEDVRACAQRMLKSDGCVVLGCRDFDDPKVPWKSRMGNRITRTVFRLFCGIPVSDTQTGLRAIPFKVLPLMLETEGSRYEYETEMFFTLKNARVGIVEQRIETVYEPGNPTSHFHPFRDSLAIYRKIGAFTLSSCAGSAVDYALFTLLSFLLLDTLSRGLRQFIAVFGARAVSSFVNYSLNRRAVFRSDAPARRTLLRYYVLCAAQTAASYLLLFLISDILRAGALLEVALKIVIDVLLFMASFQIQHRWVFK